MCYFNDFLVMYFDFEIMIILLGDGLFIFKRKKIGGVL